MAYPVTLQTLMLKARQRANLETNQQAAPDDFISDDELIEEVNSSLAEWVDLVRSVGWNGTYFRKRYPFQTTATTVPTPPVSPPPGSYYALPPDFLHVISVDIAIGQNLVITARAFQEEQRNIFKFYPIGAWTWNEPVYYRIDAGNIVFIPGPLGSYNIQLNYCPVGPSLSRPNDSFDSINKWEEWIVCDVAAKMLLKEGDLAMVQALEGRREIQEARIKKLAPKRDMQTAEMVHESLDQDAWWFG